MSTLREDAAVPAGNVSVAALAWRFRGVVRVTVIAKATFALAPEGPMPRVAPQPILRTEVHHGNNPLRSIRLTTDLAPYLNHADVLFTGHAHAPNGVLVGTLPVRLGVYDGARSVLDKTVLVRDPNGVNLMPIVYERAYGGPGTENFYGVGVPEGSGEPNLIDPFDEKRRAGFGPVGPGWEARLHRTLKRSGPGGVIDLPDDLDWTWFQAAPADQRVPYLRGDEWIVLDALHQKHARLRAALPGARGVALVYGLGPWGVAEGQPVAMHADTLRIDGDEEQCSLAFRATFPVTDEAALPHVRVMLGVESAGQPIPWPDPASLLADHPGADAPESMVLSSADLEAVGGSLLVGTLTFEAPAEEPPPRVAPVAADEIDLMSTLASTPGDSIESTLHSTMWVEPAPQKPPKQPSVLPFQGSVSSPSPLRQASAAQALAHMRLDEDGGTMMTTPEDELRVAQQGALPFLGTKPLPAPPPPAPPPPVPEPPAATPEPQRAWSWAAEPEPPAAAPLPTAPLPPRTPPPPPAPPAVTSTVKKGLYGRFGGKR
jgi:hypothetical protein